MAGKPQTLSKGQEERVVQILWKKLIWIATVFVLLFGGSLWSIWKSVEHKMETLVAEQFSEPKIQKTVQKAAADRASVMMEKQITPEVTAFKEDVANQLDEIGKVREELTKQIQSAEGKLADLDKVVADATSTLSELKSTNDFTATVVAAQNDSREAFDTLELWANDKNNPFCHEAEQAWLTVFGSHLPPFKSLALDVPWGDNIDPSKLSFSELIALYNEAPISIEPALIKYIWSREDIKKIDRLNFLIDVMIKDKSLRAVEHAGCLFSENTEQEVAPLAIKRLAAWWEEHKHEFEQDNPPQLPIE